MDEPCVGTNEIESDVQYALYPSRKTEKMTVGVGTHAVHGRFRVGYDVFKIAGHTVVDNVVYLTLESAGWVRNVDALKDRGRGGLCV